MWTQDTITYNGKAYRYAVKHFEEPSEFGYNEGRASKIWIERGGRTVFNYDRGYQYFRVIRINLLHYLKHCKSSNYFLIIYVSIKSH